MTKEDLKIKEEVKRMANRLKFQSVMFADEFGHSNKEDLRYQLWLIELIKWLCDNYTEYVFSRGSHLRTGNLLYAIDKVEYLSELVFNTLKEIENGTDKG